LMSEGGMPRRQKCCFPAICRDSGNTRQRLIFLGGVLIFRRANLTGRANVFYSIIPAFMQTEASG
ncbi:hypothetical protein, partial [Neisseria gonorrhoeae]|uniref:hypothetical protein n=1 Tax=Neisseria gonorrhoeae TaxID=485 RepID=UPI00227723CD